MKYGLIGWPLGHSFSVKIHRQLGNRDYQLYPLREGELEAFLRRPDLGGLNVTIPYKKAVIPYCASLSGTAREIGSVNTLVFTERGIIGHNTDCTGFLTMTERAGISMAGRKVVILGTGGTSLTAAWCAKKLGAAQIVKIFRGGADNYGSLERHRDAEILINTTPVGMYPDNGASPVQLSSFDGLKGVLDVVYNPLKTELILQAEALGIPCSGGLPMLVEQAAAAHRLFFGREPEAEVTERVLEALRREQENIVLIGMPGCGKSSVGRLLAGLLKRPFLDLDEAIQREDGRTPEQIIQQDGEAAFRDAETAAVKRAAKETGLVIACGGGVPLRTENVRALRQNGKILWIRRKLEELAVEGRPLSADLPALYEKRRPYYEAAADLALDNEGTPEELAAEIAAMQRQD